jgi:hypothetical protein
MNYRYPEPQEVGIEVPLTFVEDRFRAGFRHALIGGKLLKPEYLRRSFREGFRAGKLYLRELRRAQGVVSFPLQGKIRLTAVH